MKNKLLPLIILALFSLSTVSLVCGDVLYDMNTVGGATGTWRTINGAVNSIYGFTVNGNGGGLTQVQWSVKNTTSAPSGGLECIVYGTNNLTTTNPFSPSNGAIPYAHSNNTFNCAAITGTTTITFYFSLGAITLTYGQRFFIALNVTGILANVQYAELSVTGAGFSYSTNGGTSWNPATTSRPVFWIYTTDVAAPGLGSDLNPPNPTLFINFNQSSPTDGTFYDCGNSTLAGYAAASGNNQYLYKMYFKLKINAAAPPYTGILRASVFNNISASHYPYAGLAPYAYSDSYLNVTSITNTYQWFPFYFNCSINITSTKEWGFALSAINSVGLPFYYGKLDVTTTGFNDAYGTNQWGNVNIQPAMIVYTTTLFHGLPSGLSYSYDINPDPTYNFYDWGTGAVITQARNYTYTGTILNNTLPYVNGTFNVYKTTLYKGNLDAPVSTITNAANALGSGSVTLNGTGTVTNGVFTFYIYQDYYFGSVLTFQGFRINGTVNGTTDTFTSDLVIVASEPALIFDLGFSGGHFGGSTTYIATAPTEVFMQMGTTYNVRGTVYYGGVIGGNGTFSTQSTGLSVNSLIFQNGAYTQTATGTITNGQFTFVLGSRSAPSDVYEGFKVVITMSDNSTAEKIYNLRWRSDAWAPTWTTTPLYPADSSGLNGSMNIIINFLLLFLLVGAPALILGSKAGLPGLIVGGVFGLGLGAIAGIVPFWFILFCGAGIVAAFLMWRKNNGQG